MTLTSRHRSAAGARRAPLWALINLVMAVYAGLWTAFWALAAWVARALSRDPAISLAIARRFWAPGLLRFGGMRVEVTGLENLDASKPCFFAANHQSMLDVPVLYEGLPVPLLFIVKEELRGVPLLGGYMSAVGMIFIRRRQRRRSLEAMELCGRRLAEGCSIVIFPEGTRSRDGTVGPFKPAAFLPPIDTGTPIVPVAIDGPGRVIPPGGFRVCPGRLRLAVGRPIATAGLERGDRRDLARRVREQVVGLWQGLVEAELSPEQLAALERTRERMSHGHDLGDRMPPRDELHRR